MKKCNILRRIYRHIKIATLEICGYVNLAKTQLVEMESLFAIPLMI